MSTVHVRQIIEKYKNGDALLYNKLVNLCTTLSKDAYREAAVLDFLKQCSDVVDLLVDDDSPLTDALLNVPWHRLQASGIDVLSTITVQLALHRLDWLTIIVQSLIGNWLDDDLFVIAQQEESKQSQPGASTSSEESTADVISRCTHNALQKLMIVNGVFDEHGIVYKTCSHLFPHDSAPTPKLRYFLQNVMLMSTYANECASALWSLVVDKLLYLDVAIDRQLTKLSDQAQQKANKLVFEMVDKDDDSETKEEEDEMEKMRAAVVNKLDMCMNDVFCFVERVRNGEIEFCTDEDDEDEDTTKVVGPDWLLDKLMPSLHNSVLFAHDARHVPFIWMAVVHGNKEVTASLLTSLSQLVDTPDLVTVRQSHSALCFMASFLARSTSVSVCDCASYISVWMSWAWRHHTECLAEGRSTEGLLVHGTFYAVCHAVMLVFVYRCKQMVNHKMIGMSTIRSWHFDRLCHSVLNPLRYVDANIVAAFASICRSMQLAYCQHIIEHNRRLDQTAIGTTLVPFEPTFPFEPYTLPSTESFVSAMYTDFTVLSDVDEQMTVAEGKWNSAVQRKRQVSCMSDDFLMDDPLTPPDNKPSTAVVGSIGEMVALGDYTAPGLRHKQTGRL